MAPARGLAAALLLAALLLAHLAVTPVASYADSATTALGADTARAHTWDLAAAAVAGALQTLLFCSTSRHRHL
jgi:hypothetical protein